MKTLATRIALFAAGTLALGTMAYGQDRTVTANIPFAFQTVNATLPSGDYRVVISSSHGGAAIVTLRNAKTRNSVMMLGHRQLGAPGTADAAPSMTFVCGPESCSLRKIWTGESALEYNVHGRKLAPNEHIASIPLVVSHTE